MKWYQVILVFLALLNVTQSASLKTAAAGILCDACSDIVNGIRKLVELKASESLIEEAVIEYCKLYKLADDRICKLIIPEFKVIRVIYLYNVIFALG